MLIAVDASTSSPCSTGDFTSEINGLRLPGLKQLDARFTKSFGLAGLDLTAYADVRNILNFTNIIRVFQGNNDIVNAVEFSADSGLSAQSLQTEATQNEAFDAATGDIDLRFDGAGISGCSGWVNSLDARPPRPIASIWPGPSSASATGMGCTRPTSSSAPSTRITAPSGTGTSSPTLPGACAWDSRSTSERSTPPPPGPATGSGGGRFGYSLERTQCNSFFVGECCARRGSSRWR